MSELDEAAGELLAALEQARDGADASTIAVLAASAVAIAQARNEPLIAARLDGIAAALGGTPQPDLRTTLGDSITDAQFTAANTEGADLPPDSAATQLWIILRVLSTVDASSAE